ncbi:MAG TPA: hypothetical protein VLT17_05290 [Gemmatimonadales bacterium]|jgi:hypothetical protein|nr:hypothetical protein [Gemmatimonadales bacterium]
MTRTVAALLLLLALGACRDYDYYRPIASQKGLLPADQFALYGREQAITVAIGRELARPYNSGTGVQIRRAMEYAQKFPDVVQVEGDSLGYRLTVLFKNGWRTAVVPIADGKRGDETKIPS